MVSVLLLGGNEKDTLQAFMKLREILGDQIQGKVVFESDVIQSKPEDDLDQADFYNSFVVVETSLSPFLLLEKLQSLEIKLGRNRNLLRPKGPRLIDIDILFYEDFMIGTELLQIPHPQVFERKFVGKLLKQMPKEYQSLLPEGTGI